MLILDETVRYNIHLYTDALGVGIGGFFFTLDTAVLWQDAIPLIIKEHSFQTRLQQMHILSKQESHVTDSFTSTPLITKEHSFQSHL